MGKATVQPNGLSVQDLWDALDDMPVDEHEGIELPFLHFEVGTHRETIWHWFEDTFGVSVHKMMYGYD